MAEAQEILRMAISSTQYHFSSSFTLAEGQALSTVTQKPSLCVVEGYA